MRDDISGPIKRGSRKFLAAFSDHRNEIVGVILIYGNDLNVHDAFFASHMDEGLFGRDMLVDLLVHHGTGLLVDQDHYPAGAGKDPGRDVLDGALEGQDLVEARGVLEGLEIEGVAHIADTEGLEGLPWVLEDVSIEIVSDARAAGQEHGRVEHVRVLQYGLVEARIYLAQVCNVALDAVAALGDEHELVGISDELDGKMPSAEIVEELVDVEHHVQAEASKD